MAMEFGKNWLQPINLRLKSKFNHLSDLDIITYDELCRTAMSQGHSFIMDTLIALVDEHKTITAHDLKLRFNDYIKKHYDWINGVNISKLHSQGLYYAWKEGLDKVVVD